MIHIAFVDIFTKLTQCSSYISSRMKQRFFAFFIILFGGTLNVCASTYYLSSSFGDDNFSGIYPDSAWKTLEKLNSITLFPGDSVLLKSNDVFYGTIILSNSGNFSLPIYFGKFGSGSLPIVTGGKKLLGFSQAGNIYSVQDTDYIRSIWLNGKWMQPARFPNKGFISTFASGVNNFLNNPSLTQVDGYWDNASVAIRSTRYKYEISRVDTFSQGTVMLSQPTQYNIPDFFGFFFFNKLSELDTVNEWFCDTLANQVYIIPPIGINFINSSVEASVVDFGVYSANDISNIIIDGIELNGQSKDAIRFQGLASEIKIVNCQFKRCKEWAISFKQTTLNCQLLNNEIEDCGGGGIFSEFFFHCRICDNQIKRIGLERGFGFDNYSQGNGIQLSSAIYDTVLNNIIDSCGYAGITIYNKFNILKKNSLNHCMLLLDEGGALVCYGQESDFNIIDDNFILNTKGNLEGTTIQKKSSYGIYLADNLNNDSIIHNTIVNSASYGIYFGPFNHHHSFKNNLVYNNQEGQIFIADGDLVNTTNNIQLHNNILYSLNEKQKVIQISGKSYSFFPIKGDSNYYCNPYDYFPIYQSSNFDTVIRQKAFSLSLWNQTTAQDSNSHVSNVEWQNYYTTDTLGTDLIENGDFSNNFDGWITEPLNNNSLLLDNSTMMDGGCIKFEVTGAIPFDYAKIVSNDLQLQANQYYQLSFSSSGNLEGIMYSDIKQQYAPYNSMGLIKYFPIKENRKNFTSIFSTLYYGSPLALNFELSKSDSLVYFDNIHLFSVDVFKHDSSRMSVLLMNYSPNILNIPLGTDSVFRDLDGNFVSSSYTLNPYSSYVLVLDSPLNLVSVKEIKNANSINIFPNPIQTSNGKVNVQMPDLNKYEYEVYDLMGRAFLTGEFSGSTIHSFTMAGAPAGIYFLSIHSSNIIWQQKFVVIN